MLRSLYPAGWSGIIPALESLKQKTEFKDNLELHNKTMTQKASTGDAAGACRVCECEPFPVGASYFPFLSFILPGIDLYEYLGKT